jgi:NAD(P)H-hydrate repair Nnr-like enzyme with NAD(P)H-hydrate dehydratase domain
MVETLLAQHATNALARGMRVHGRIGDVAKERATIDLRFVRQRPQQLPR